jgi:peroxiredoxin
MTYDPDKLTSEDEIRYLRNYIDRNKLEMSLLSDAIEEIDDLLNLDKSWLNNEVASAGIKSLKKRLEEELTEKALKSLEIKNEHGELLAALAEA